jgi:pyruvate formate lyase activating enzyme
MQYGKKTSLEIKGFLETSLIDWDGKIVCVVFLPGCNFRCPFCHNAGLFEHPEKYKTIPEERVFKYLGSHEDFIDGVCITGGEPTMHKKKGLTEFIKKVKKMGFLVKLDTNGADPEYIKELVHQKLIDFVAMDLKAPLEAYNNAANVKVDIMKIKESINFLLSGEVDYEFRTTIVPTIFGLEEIEDAVLLINGAKKYALQQFEPEHCEDISLKKLKPADIETVTEMMDIAKKHVKKVIYRGK